MVEAYDATFVLVGMGYPSPDQFWRNILRAEGIPVQMPGEAKASASPMGPAVERKKMGKGVRWGGGVVSNAEEARVQKDIMKMFGQIGKTEKKPKK